MSILKKILIVEDDEEIAEVLAFNLDRHGYGILRAGNGLAACRIIEKDRPDLILLDLMLPDLDGRELCKMVRAHHDESISGIPVIMLTALANSMDRVRGLELGADDYVTKPFSVEEVLLRVKKLVARADAAKRAAPPVSPEHQEGKAVQEFQDMVFHELANQLLVVRGFSDRLVRNGDILPQDKVRSYAQAIYNSSTHLGSLAEEVLLLGRLRDQRSRIAKHEIRVADLATELRGVIAQHAEERGISVCIEVPECFPSLHLNQPSLKIILSCLLENAVKYGRLGGKVLLTAALLPNGSAAIYVEDDGIGIPLEEVDQVFEKFHRGSNVARATKGSGLGLYFAKTLTEAMGGTITLASELGSGTRLRIAFPASEVSKAA